MAATVQSFIDQLTLNHRVVVLGGVAVIAHGYSRHTQDADIWLDPMSSAEEWADAVLSVCTKFKGATIHRLPGWTEVIGMQLAMTHLREFAAAGDPFSLAILEGRELP